MANEKFTDLPTVVSATTADIIAAVQSGTSVQETLGQVQTLMQAGIIKNNAGNPNGSVSGTVYGLCWDRSNNLLYVCTTSGNAATAVWTLAGSVALPVPASQGGTGVASPTARTVPVANGASAFTFLGPLTNGQLLIGSTGANPVPATLSAGPGVSISNGAGTVTISGTGSGIGWTEVTGTSQAMTADNGYVANNGSLVTLTLPTTAAFGTAINVIGKGAGGWAIAQNANQLIHLGSSVTTTGVGGSLASSNQYDSIELICTVANLEWTAMGGPQGNITVV